MKEKIYSISIEEKEKNIYYKEKNKKILNIFYPKEKRKEKNSIIKLKYKILNDKKELIIFGKKFTNNNNNKIKLIIKNKIDILKYIKI